MIDHNQFPVGEALSKKAFNRDANMFLVVVTERDNGTRCNVVRAESPEDRFASSFEKAVAKGDDKRLFLSQKQSLNAFLPIERSSL